MGAADLKQHDESVTPQGGVGDSAKVGPIHGTQKQSRARSLVNVTTRERAEWPSGANIRHLSVFVDLEGTAAPVAGQEARVYAILCIDAESTLEADAILGSSGNPPENKTSDAQFIPIPLNTVVEIPLTAALVNGSMGGGCVDVRSVDGTAINVWIGAN